ncbi:MAG: glycosyltransferase family 4 protein [Verrucomicrobiales bacterium]|nr:glycosyltransferase family 4 protein [Verrucomicrobiales bacterium]
MKIAINSPAFPPQIGGLEEVARICAEEFTRKGHDVTVITEAQNEPHVEFPFSVHRKATLRERLQTFQSADVVLMFNFSMKALPLVLLSKTPLVISHQGWYGPGEQAITLKALMKIFASRWTATNVACSNSVARYVGTKTHCIPNPYNDQFFKLRPQVARERDFLFVGRLVSDKGANIFVDALAKLHRSGVRSRSTITGSGPEEWALIDQVKQTGLADSISFTGPLRGELLAKEMNRHRCLVVPSRWAEPFGIVALEGVASGCIVIGSNAGGLPEAIGPGGVTFPNGDTHSLAERMKEAMVSIQLNKSQVEHHLDIHRGERIAENYLRVLLNQAKRC